MVDAVLLPRHQVVVRRLLDSRAQLVQVVDIAKLFPIQVILLDVDGGLQVGLVPVRLLHGVGVHGQHMPPAVAVPVGALIALGLGLDVPVGPGQLRKDRHVRPLHEGHAVEGVDDILAGQVRQLPVVYDVHLVDPSDGRVALDVGEIQPLAQVRPQDHPLHPDADTRVIHHQVKEPALPELPQDPPPGIPGVDIVLQELVQPRGHKLGGIQDGVGAALHALLHGNAPVPPGRAGDLP